MSDVSTKDKKGSGRCQRSIYQVHYGLARRAEAMARPLPASGDVTAYGLQVAGHQKTENTKYFGLLQCSNGTVLKPILKECQRREVDFYQRLEATDDPHLLELKRFVPQYYGCTKYTYNGYQQEYIVLEDLTHRMLEPCVMDVKIGRRTWDPLATTDKIAREQSKYADSKRQFAFSIPGYQLHELRTGRLRRAGKEHGKGLRGDMVIQTFRTFLNGAGSGRVCRALVLQFLGTLWRLQRAARRAGTLRLYAGSVLLLYDAAALRKCCGGTDSDTSPLVCRIPPPPKRTLSNCGSLSGSLSPTGPVYKKLSPVPLSPMAELQQAFAPPPAVTSPWTEALDKLTASHSFDHNYEDKLCQIRVNYRTMLDQLSSETPGPNPWGAVKVIDFAHAFFEEEPSVDENFLEGIDNLVKMFEKLLKETEDGLI